MACQVEHIDIVGRENTLANRLYQFPVRNLKRLKMAVSELRGSLSRRKAPASCGLPQLALRPGDIVTVRSPEEIRSTLDVTGALGGCHFMREMYAYCGQTYRVLKVVEQFYDEVTQKVCRCRDTVILEGTVCSGRQRLYRSQCDRNCFFFWRTAWLQKIN